ncbi:MAG: PAS domain-containing sensor histidine kinase [Syntrophaceae bacterium]|nr:PAS domain-containing sensor histidine kinase [Syntrophaceae bacterium]
MAMRDGKEKSLIKQIESLRERIAALEHSVTERKKIEEIFHNLFNATEEIVILMDRDGIILMANTNAARLYGVPMEKLSGRSIYDFIPTDRIHSSKEKVKTVLETRKPVRFEGKLGEKVFENNLYPVLKDSSEVERIAIYIRDVTERKRLEVMVKQTEEKYRNIYENAMEGIFQVAPDGHFISANPSLAHIHGYDSPEELIQSIKNIRSIYVNPDDHHRLINLLFEKGSVQNHEAKMYRKDGSLQWISVNVRLVRDDQSKPLYYEGTMMDITNRKMAEEALTESEERYRIAIENSNDAVAIIQGEKIQYVNRRFVEIFGYRDTGEMIDQPVVLVVHPDDREKVLAINRRRQRGESVPFRYEFKGVTREGKIIFIEVSAASIVYRGRPVYLVYLRDVTERIKAEEVMRKERNRFQTLLENAPFGIIMVNQEGGFEYINPKFKEIFGYELHEVPNSFEWFKKAFPDSKSRKEVISAWIEYLRSTKPGEKVPRTLPATCKDGTQKIIHFIPFRLETGEYIVTLDDITERIQAQEALFKSHRVLEQLNRAKTKAVNLISHELRTPLAVIQGNLRLLKKKLKSLPIQSGIQNTMEVLERNLNRLSNISKETDEIFRVSQELEAGVLLDNLDRLWQRVEDLSELPSDVRSHFDSLKTWLSQYLSGKKEEYQSVNLFPFALDVLERVKHLTRHREIRFQAEGKSDLFILIDPLILQNVLEGLLKNAVENTPDGGTIRLVVEQRHGKILLHIADDGIGITEENQAYLFDGLFPTKETELYASKKPYDFGAGGKGLDLLRMKVYAQRFDFDLSMKSKRCIYLPTDRDLCPGEISKCSHVRNAKECAASGGTTFTLAFQPKKTNPLAHI